MDFNFDDLRKEFDAQKMVKEESCEISCKDEDEALGFIETISKYMLAPANCGVYFSRLDIKVIGLKFGEDVQVRERKRMLRDILKAVTSKGEFEKLVRIINDTSDEKIAIYEELSSHFPCSENIFEEKKIKNEKFRKVLENILKEFEEID